MKSRSIQRAVACIVLALATSACATSRTTTTTRTAVEQALISQAVAEGVGELDAAPAAGHTFALLDEQFSPTDKEFFSAALRARLLESGLHENGGKDEAEVLVYPRSYFLAIDDTKFLVGIPSFKLPAPGGV